MQKILNFLIRYKVTLVFLLLLFVGLRLTFYAHTYQNTNIVNSTNLISSNLYNLQASIKSYFNLKPQNDALQQENKYLRSLVLNQSQLDFDSLTQIDSISGLKFKDSLYQITTAEVVSNNYHQPDNFLLINRGFSDSIETDLAVISSLGIVGIVEYTSARFSRVISVLNRHISVNAKLKKSNHFGTLTWDAKSPAIAKLNDLPRAAPIQKGDTIVTGGKSFIFPGELPIGVVDDFELNVNKGYYEIDVKLFNDMTNLGKVYVLKSLDRDEAMNTLNTDQDEN